MTFIISVIKPAPEDYALISPQSGGMTSGIMECWKNGILGVNIG
jgi:hypothetical protein